MNILISTLFYDNKTPFATFYEHMYLWLTKNISYKNASIKFIITEPFFDEYNKIKKKFENITPIFITKRDLIFIFGDELSKEEIHKKIHITNLNQTELERLKLITKKILGDWTPDVIFLQGYFSASKTFGKIYPNALCLSAENAIFSRPPFFRTLAYDPYDSAPDNFLVKFHNQIKNYEISEEENQDVNNFKHALTNIIDSHSKIEKEMIKYKQQFKKLILFPLIGSYFNELYMDSLYLNENELIDYVLKNTPADIGIIVTQHDTFDSLTKKEIDYFSSKYKNFIFLKNNDKRNFTSNSLHYFKYVVAVLNTTSKTALMAMLWDKPILSLAKTANELIKDGQGIEDLEKILYTPYKNKNNIIYWYFTHYILLEPDYTKQDYMFYYLEEKLKYFREHGIDFEYYNKINSMKEVSDKIINYVKEYYDKAEPLVSVFLPYYNDRKYLREAIESVLNQTYPNWELILLNHATEDDCREIAHSYTDNRIKHIDMDENLGAGGGVLFEKMLKASGGKYIKTLCADDVLKPHCLEILVNYMETHPEKDFAFGNTEYINEKGKDMHASWFTHRNRASYDNDELKCIRWYARNLSILPYIGSIVKRDALMNIHIDKTMVMLFDMSLWLSLLCKGYKIGYCKQIVADYRITKNQFSSVKNHKAVMKYSWFEHSQFCKIFFTIKDVEFAKRIWGQSLYKDCLTKVEDIPFFVAIETFHKQSPFMYSYLSDILQNPEKEEYYKKTFNFGIKELRHLCLYDRHEIIPKTLIGKIEKHINSKRPTELNLLERIYLMLKYAWDIMTLKPIIERFFNKKYTL